MAETEGWGEKGRLWAKIYLVFWESEHRDKKGDSSPSATKLERLGLWNWRMGRTVKITLSPWLFWPVVLQGVGG